MSEAQKNPWVSKAGRTLDSVEEKIRTSGSRDRAEDR
jgi:hypothetical protein